MMRYKNRIYSLVIGMLIIVIGLTLVWGTEKNGFDLDDALIPENEIYHGGPGKDGIPAINKPKFVSASTTDWLEDDDRVLALEMRGLAKAYPVKILNWHEIVNDQIRGRELVITYCPLCGSGMAFSAKSGYQSLKFGVSGLLYNSDVLLYDIETESLWSQLMRQAVAGPLKGSKLTLLPMEHTTWERWKNLHPDTLVLSTDTGYSRNYRQTPYAGYENREGLYFPVTKLDPRHHPKQWTLGVEIDNRFKAYPFVELDKAGGQVNDSLAGQDFTVIYDRKSQSARIEDLSGSPIPSVSTFWFAWMAFHPDSEIYESP